MPATHRQEGRAGGKRLRMTAALERPVAAERQVEPSVAFLYLFLGLSADGPPLDLPKHNLWIFPDCARSALPCPRLRPH